MIWIKIFPVLTMRFDHVLAVLLSCTSIALVMQDKVVANPSSSTVNFSVNKLRKTAQETTVFIGSERENGSGLIIARKAQSYYVLTSAHVLRANDGYQITTPDRRRYGASIVARRLPGLDLAILEFKSQQSYRVATLANYDQTDKGLIDGGNVYVSGWDASNSSNQSVFSCGTKFQGDIANLLFIRKDPVSDGYELAYTNITQPGLSGGPIFDVQGRVIGVHGQAEGSNFEGIGSIKLGFSLGIPIQRFLQFIEKSSIQLPLVVEQKPPENSSSLSWSGSDPCEKNIPLLPTADADGLDWANYANSMLRLFRLAEALSAYEKAVGRKEELYQVWYGRGLALLLSDRPNEALRSFNKALDLLEKSEPTNVEELRSANQSRSALLRYKGMLLFGKQDYQGALFSYNEALRFQPSNPQIWMLKAGVLRDLNQDKEAINAYTKAIQIEPRPLFFLSRSGWYTQNGQYTLALEDLDSVIKLDPNNPQAYASRGALKKKLGDQEGSRSDYEQVYKLTYQNSDLSKFNYPLILIGQAELSVGIIKDGSQAVAQGMSFGNGPMGGLLSTLLQEVFNNPDKMRDPEFFANTIISGIGGSQDGMKLSEFDIHLMRASTYLQFGLASYLQTGSLSPLNESILKKTLSEIDHAIEVGRGNEKVYSVYAMRSAFQEKKGDGIAARNDFDEALKAKENLSEIYESRALAHVSLGNKAGALADFRAASQIVYQQKDMDKYQEIMSIIDKIQSQPVP